MWATLLRLNTSEIDAPWPPMPQLECALNRGHFSHTPAANRSRASFVRNKGLIGFGSNLGTLGTEVSKDVKLSHQFCWK